MVAGGLRPFAESIELRQRLMRERLAWMDREQLLERGLAFIVALGGETQNAQPHAKVERPRCGFGVGFEDLDGLIQALGLPEMLGGFARQHGIIRVRLERQQETPVHFRPRVRIVCFMEAARERRVEQDRFRIIGGEHV